MGKTYLNASQEVIDLLEETRGRFHERFEGVKFGIIMAHAPVDEKTGRVKGFAIKGYAGAAAAAQVKVVALKDRLTKGYDVELLIDGDNWPNTPLPTQIALLDHELTHIRPTGLRDDLGRPSIKLREEDFIVWGFIEVAQRHGIAAIECRSVKQLMDEHGQILLALDDRADLATGEGTKSLRRMVQDLKDKGVTLTVNSGSSN